MGNELVIGDNKIDLTGVDVEAILKVVNKLKNPPKKRGSAVDYVGIDSVTWDETKGLVFNFKNGTSCFYNFAEKVLCHSDGTPFLVSHINKLDLDDVDDFDVHLWHNMQNYCKDDKSKRFFQLLHSWSDKYYGIDMKRRCRFHIFMGSNSTVEHAPQILANLESVVLCPALDHYSSPEIIKMSMGIERGERTDSTASASVLLKQTISSWFTEHAAELTAPGYQVSSGRWNRDGVVYEDAVALATFRDTYTEFKKNKFHHVFEYCWEKYKKPLKCLDLVKVLTEAGHEYKRLVDYLMYDLGNQGHPVTSDTDQNDGFGEYRDYVRMNQEMEVDYDKYPRFMATAHDVTTMNYKIWQARKLQAPFDTSLLEDIQRLEYTAPASSEYEIVLPNSPVDIIKEGNMQNHCVGSYVPRVLAKETFIVFMRLKKEPKKSLITVEVSPNLEIKQAKGVHNRRTTAEEQAFIDGYQKHLAKKFGSVV